MFDIVSLGELLIDFAPMGPRAYQANAGGAPANVLAAAAKLGKKAAFIGMVGQDDFGELLAGDLQEAGIDVTGLCHTQKANTTLAFVNLDSHGDRSFTFVRRPGADMLLEWGDVKKNLVTETKIFHFGSVSMTHEPCRSTTLRAARLAHEEGATVSFDPNLRPLLWDNLDDAKKVILKGMQYTDILKISEEELTFLTGQTDLDKGSDALMAMGPRLIYITLGPKGCFYKCKTGSNRLPTYDTAVVDTTGSGDAFLGGVLTALLDMGIESLEELRLEQLDQVADYGNLAGSLVASKKGAIPSMPNRAQMEECKTTTPKLIIMTDFA